MVILTGATVALGEKILINNSHYFYNEQLTDATALFNHLKSTCTRIFTVRVN